MATTYIIYRRWDKVNEINKNLTPFLPHYDGWKFLRAIKYNEVKWDVVYPQPFPHDVLLFSRPLSTEEKIKFEELKVVGPFCPKCSTKLMQRKNFFKGYTWSCPKCGFKKRSTENFERVIPKVLEIAISEYKLKLSSQDTFDN